MTVEMSATPGLGTGGQENAGTLDNQSTPVWADAAYRRDLLIVRTLTECPEWAVLRVMPKIVIDQATGCHEWQGAKDRDGYGRVALPYAITGSKTLVGVHRVALILEADGPLPYGLTSQHDCMNTSCCSPAHLRPLTQGQNSLAEGARTVNAINAATTHCRRCGRALRSDNLVPSELARGKRKCIACDRDSSREQAAAIRAAREALGLSRDEYVAIFGWGRTTAERILDSLARGVRREVLIAGALVATSDGGTL